MTDLTASNRSGPRSSVLRRGAPWLLAATVATGAGCPGGASAGSSALEHGPARVPSQASPDPCCEAKPAAPVSPPQTAPLRAAEAPDPCCEAQDAPPPPDPCCGTEAASAAPAAPLPDTSLYQLESRWTDQRGEARHLRDLRGRVVIAAMVFTRCAYACPAILADLRAIDASLGAAREDVRYLLVSFDSARDTPQNLAEYAREQGLDARWTLLHGDPGAVRELAATLNVRYAQAAPNGDFAHSNQIHVLSREGVLVHQQEGLGADPGPTVAAVQLQLSPER